MRSDLARRTSPAKKIMNVYQATINYSLLGNLFDLLRIRTVFTGSRPCLTKLHFQKSP